MCKSKIFADILQIVANQTEISSERILSNAKEVEIVDARAILVSILHEHGFYPKQIAYHINKTGASVRYLISTFDERRNANKMIAINMQNIRKQLENK